MIICPGNIWCQMIEYVKGVTHDSMYWKYLVPNVVEYVKGVTHDNTNWKYLVPNVVEYVKGVTHDYMY